jgi:N-acetylmuramoyl-L-alanine amidase
MAKRPKVWVDAGHGGNDPGASGFGLVEKNMTLVTAFAVKEELEAHGVEVGMTRTTDVYVDLSKRAQMANAWGADLFVSCHYNAGGGDGAEVIHSVSGGVSKSLAENIVNYIKKELGQNLRPNPVYSRTNKNGKDYYAVIRETKMPAVIVEPGFVDSNDRLLFDTVEEQKKVGIAIAHGILKQLNIPIKKQQETKKPNPQPAAKKIVTVTAYVLNVRQGAGTDYKVLGTVKKDTKLEVLETKNGWYKIKFESGYGWISSKYTK